MNFLIIGGSGFLGQYVIRELLKNGSINKLYCLVHRTDIPVEGKKIVKIKGSILNLDVVRIPERLDVCIVLSGVTNGLDMDAESAMAVNYKGVQKTVEYCKKNQIGRICLISSINVNLEKQGAYARSKAEAEKAVKESGLSYLIFRPALIFGAGCKKGLKMVEDFIMKYGVVPVFGSGKKMEQPVWVGECAAFIAWYLLGSSWDRTIELYGRDAMAYDQMCYKIADVLGKQVRLFHIPVWICDLGLRIVEALHIRFPISREQIYHIDTDLCADMGRVYSETGIYGDSFENNLRKGRILQ